MTEAKHLVVDLHTHSRFAMATSRSLDVAALANAARRKGVDLLATGDFTHPTWRAELRSQLVESSEGVFCSDSGARFILGTEISCVWSQGGRGRRVHILVFVPNFASADALSDRLSKHCRLESDGRPMVRLSGRELLSLVLETDPGAFVIPAHVWTPWYGLYGSKSGFDSMAECFGDLSDQVPAIETGLSSDPAMNWGFGDLNGRAIVSFSDAHSAATIGREVTVLDASPTFRSIANAIRRQHVIETIEFYPESGKYHLDGHRKCSVRYEPEATPRNGRCPRCGRPLTLGVVHRVHDLAGASEERVPDENGLIRDPGGRPPFRRLVPLRDLIAEALGVGPATQRVQRACDTLVEHFGNEFAVLLESRSDDLADLAPEPVANAILAARSGDVEIDPGYDGAFGTVKARRSAP